MGREELVLILAWMDELHEAWRLTNHALVDVAAASGRQADAYALVAQNMPRDNRMLALERQLRERLATLSDRRAAE